MQLPRVVLLLLPLLTCTADPVFAQTPPPTAVYASPTELRWTHPAPEEVASWIVEVSGVRLGKATWTRTGPDSFEAPVQLVAPLSVTVVAVGLDGLESAPSNRLIYWGGSICPEGSGDCVIYGSTPTCRADLNGNGAVDLPDGGQWLMLLGGTCP